MATMKEVAELSGVSVTTVSHVINNTRFVSEQIVARVNGAIEKLNYVPSVVARSLKNNQSKSIGMLVPNNSIPFFADLIWGIEDICYHQDYSVILCNTDDNRKKQIKYLEVLIAKQIDGLIVVASGVEDNLVDLLSKQSIPISIVDREIPGLEADRFAADNELGGFLATKHLIKLGHEKIGCISGPTDLKPSIGRVFGFKRALRNHGLELNPNWLRQSDFKSKGGYEAMNHILNQKQHPSAIFACNDLMAFGSLSAAYERQISIPKQLSIIGYDDILLASYSCPPLTTIMQPSHELGVMAAQALLDRVKDDQMPRQNTGLEPHLVVRKSTEKIG